MAKIEVVDTAVTEHLGSIKKAKSLLGRAARSRSPGKAVAILAKAGVPGLRSDMGKDEALTVAAKHFGVSKDCWKADQPLTTKGRKFLEEKTRATGVNQFPPGSEEYKDYVIKVTSERWRLRDYDKRWGPEPGPAHPIATTRIRDDD